MNVRFKNKTLEKNYTDFKSSCKAYGKEVARKYIQRIKIIYEVENINELRNIRALKCHSLKGDRRDEWSVKLTGQMRLIFTLHGSNLEIVRIEEVSKHYD